MFSWVKYMPFWMKLLWIVMILTLIPWEFLIKYLSGR